MGLIERSETGSARWIDRDAIGQVSLHGDTAGKRAQRIALFLEDLKGGGVQKITLTLAGALAERGHQVDLVLCRLEGPLAEQLPEGVRVMLLKAVPKWRAQASAFAAVPQGFSQLLRPVLLPFKPSKTLRYLPDMVRYLQHERPFALLTATPYMNVEALLARRLAAVPARVVVSEHVDVLHSISVAKDWRRRYLQPLIGRAYQAADAIVAVSHGVAKNLALHRGIPREDITTIYNPAIPPDVVDKARGPLEHPWFAPGAPPVLLSVGRLGRQKDLPTLLRAFARVRAGRPARLIILGDVTDSRKKTERRAELQALSAELGIADDMVLLGFIGNPFPYMARASVFVLSSIHEGFGVALAEALACGCPVVSTDCPSGPAEILENGKFGSLVPVGDDVALADAICLTLDAPPDPRKLRARAAMFSSARAVKRYEEILVGGNSNH